MNLRFVLAGGACLLAAVLLAGTARAQEPDCVEPIELKMALGLGSDADGELVAQAVTELERCRTDSWFESTFRGNALVAWVHTAAAELPSREAQRAADLERAFEAWTRATRGEARLDGLAESAFEATTGSLANAINRLGAEAWKAGDFPAAARHYERTVDVVQFMIDHPTEFAALDPATTLNPMILMAGGANQNAGNRQRAAEFYSRLAANRVGGDDYRVAYEFLADYAGELGDVGKLKSILALGRELYPTAEIFQESSWNLPK